MRRRAIYVSGIGHQSPIPNAARIGNVIASGLIRGPDPATHKLPPSIEAQCAHMFANIRETVEAGGGHVDDIDRQIRQFGRKRRGEIVAA